MVTVHDRALRIQESRLKILKPFELDETLCLYSPQDNVDSLNHPRIRSWNDFIDRRYQPSLPDGRRRIMLFMPCTKTKPYPFSLEHLHINRALLAAGYAPAGKLYPPAELMRGLPAGFPRDSVNLSPLVHANGTVLHRFVISEPLSCVPYEHIISYESENSETDAIHPAKMCSHSTGQPSTGRSTPPDRPPRNLPYASFGRIEKCKHFRSQPADQLIDFVVGRELPRRSFLQCVNRTDVGCLCRLCAALESRVGQSQFLLDG